MELSDRRLFDTLIERIDQIEDQPECGVVAYDTLVSMSRDMEGWSGLLLRTVIDVLESSDENGEEQLIELAAVSLAWSRWLRQRREREVKLPEAGEQVVVRVPNYRLRYVGTVTEDQKVFVEVLGQTYEAEEVTIFPPRRARQPQAKPSLSLQQALTRQLEHLRSQIERNTEHSVNEDKINRLAPSGSTYSNRNG